jgi:hypothetical protein
MELRISKSQLTEPTSFNTRAHQERKSGASDRLNGAPELKHE